MIGMIITTIGSLTAWMIRIKLWEKIFEENNIKIPVLWGLNQYLGGKYFFLWMKFFACMNSLNIIPMAYFTMMEHVTIHLIFAYLIFTGLVCYF